jgi:hypothetical protein
MQTGREFAQASGGGVVASLIGAFLYFITAAAVAAGPLKFPGSQLEPMKWNELSGWTADDHLARSIDYFLHVAVPTHSHNGAPVEPV